MSVGPVSRLGCEQCLRPQSARICRWISPTAHTVELVVLQHPLEEQREAGSACSVETERQFDIAFS